MAEGSGSIVNVAVVVQPDEVNVNVIVVVPDETPVTTPVDTLMVATPGALLDHVPAPSGLLKVVLAPGQMDIVPAMALIGVVVTVAVAVFSQLVLAVAVSV